RVLIACYLMPFVDRESLAQLAPYWAATDKLAEDAVNEAIAAGDVPTISRLAALGSPMRSALISLKVHEADRLTDDRFQALLKAIDDRTRRAWDAVREKKPNVPEVYLGLANLALVARDINGTIRELLEGIAACGERAELLIPLLQLMEQTQTADAVRPYAKDLLRSAETAKTDPEKWTLAALALVIADRSELALQACAKARSIKPGHPWACGIEAQLWVRTGDFLKAREALAPLRDAARTDAFLTRLHARILIGCGLWVTRDDEFQKVLDAQAQVKAKSSGPAVAFLRGVLDAPVDGERAAWVAAKAELVLAGDPGATLAARVRAEALYRLAELSAAPHPKGEGRPPLWNAQRVAAALRAFDQLPLAERTEADVVVAIAVLQLKGEGSAAPALRTIDPLLPHEVTLNAKQLEVVGAVLAANDRLDDAIRILNRSSVRSPSP
ncbi:MAG TPA: hypothetical protein VLM40_09335, partial [Gemmata sp.]|nr:hypothetical protein [Gemmata sp.]